MILKWWKRCSHFPGGRYFFSWAFWAFIPYTGSIRPEILELRKGFARVRMRDRRFYRNHLKSLHALAIANLAECASGLSLVPGLDESAQAILIKLEMEYLKKARGTLEAVSSCETFASPSEPHDCRLESKVTDRTGQAVARAFATWRVGVKKK